MWFETYLGSRMTFQHVICCPKNLTYYDTVSLEHPLAFPGSATSDHINYNCMLDAKKKENIIDLSLCAAALLL